MPPAGGFDNVKYKRNLPFRGPGGLAILGGTTLICIFGFWRYGQSNLERRYDRLPLFWNFPAFPTCPNTEGTPTFWIRPGFKPRPDASEVYLARSHHCSFTENWNVRKSGQGFTSCRC